MAGYMNTQFGNIYEGRYVNGSSAPMANGMIVELDLANGVMVVPAADANCLFSCLEAVKIYDGIQAYDFRVDAIPAGKVYYFVDAPYDGNDAADYDTATWAVPVGKLVCAHPLQVGDKFVCTTTNTVVAGAQYALKADGMIG